MARQCSRGPNSCKSRVGADVTPANPNTKQHHRSKHLRRRHEYCEQHPRQVNPRRVSIVGEDESSPEFVEANLHEIQNGGDSPVEEARGKTTRTDR
jgi:hypothetical protein